MTKLGGETGENAVILMKINNGVFSGKREGKVKAAAPGCSNLYRFTPDHRRIRTSEAHRSDAPR